MKVMNKSSDAEMVNMNTELEGREYETDDDESDENEHNDEH